MTNWLLVTRLIIVLYFLLCYTMRGMTNIALVLLCLLLHVILSMLYYVLPGDLLKKALLLASSACLILSAIYVLPLFIFLLPLTLEELFHHFHRSLFSAVIPVVLVVFFLDNTLIPEYLLVSVFSLMVFILSSKAFTRFELLMKDNDFLREKNDELYGRVHASEEYESQVKYLTQLEERNTLSQKIHDKIGHILAGSLIQLEAAAVIIDKDKDKSGEIITNVIHILKEGMESIRSTLRNIKPSPEQLGINRLKALLDEFTFSSEIKTHLTYTGNLDFISHLQWKIILDNTKEALTNTLKYSTAKDVNVTIEMMNKLIRIEIKDNGMGVSAIRKGLGLRGMGERTENAGGKLILDGSNGFSVITLLPVNEVENAN